MIQSKFVPTKETSARASDKKKDETKSNKPADASKFETYFDFKNAIKFVKPHQVLAINRGESLKVNIGALLAKDMVSLIRFHQKGSFGEN